MAQIYDSILDTIGHTPLVRVNSITRKSDSQAQVLLKLECFNPLGSVKDRIGAAMVEDALASGRITQDTILIEPTSGNTGIALAFVAAAKGIQLIVVMPETMSIERRKLIKALGAKLVLTEAKKGTQGAVDKALELAEKIPNGMVLQQFSNPANPQIHRATTAEEIWEDTDGQVDIVVAGIGTGGTITGVGERLKERKPSIQIVAVEPTGSAVLSGGKAGPHGLQGIGAGFVPKVLNTHIYDEVIQVEEKDAGETALAIIQGDGIPIGISSGAIAWAALKLAQRPENAGKTIVAVMPSGTERYLSTWLFQDLDISGDSVDEYFKS
jgi:cysteine synthase A